MKDKASFVLYSDLIHTVSQMPDDKAGLLLKHILSYVNDENPTTEDLIVKLTFEPIKQQLKRDLKKWEGKQVQRSEAGKRSAALKAEQRTSNNINEKQRPLTTVEKSSTNPTVSVNGNVSVNVNDTVNVKKEQSIGVTLVSGLPFTSFWDMYEKNVGQDKTRSSWYMLSEKERIAIMAYLPKYIKATPEVKFRKNPLNFINEKTWLDDLPKVEKKSVHTPINKFGYVKAESKETDWDVVKRDLDRIEAESK
jgi:hypothetical protein